jgi:hypothetical protein
VEPGALRFRRTCVDVAAEGPSTAKLPEGVDAEAFRADTGKTEIGQNSVDNRERRD